MKRTQFATLCLGLALLGGCQEPIPPHNPVPATPPPVEHNISISPNGLSVTHNPIANVDPNGPDLNIPKTTKIAVPKTPIDTNVGVAALNISGADETHNIDADGKEIIISGANNDVTVKGTPTKVSITGEGNTIKLESAKRLVCTGTSNKVTYSGKKPLIRNKGKKNSFKRAE